MSTTINKDDPAQVVAPAAAVACIVCDAHTAGWSCRFSGLDWWKVASSNARSSLDARHEERSASPGRARPQRRRRPKHTRSANCGDVSSSSGAHELVTYFAPDGELDHPSSVPPETSMAANSTRSDIVCHFTTLLPKIVT